MKDSKAITKRQYSQIDYWTNKKKIKEIFGKNLSIQEFDLFYAFGKSHNANVWIGEVVCVPFDGKAGRTIAFILTRDFRVKIASQQPDYNGHFAACVYETDEFHFDGNNVHHKPISMKKADRGELIGAFCVAWRKGIDRPFYIFRYLDEYRWKQRSGKKTFKSHFWEDSPDTQMEKVPEAQLLKKVWPAIFNGTFDAAELPEPNSGGVIEADYEEVENKESEPYPESPPPEPEAKPEPEPQPKEKKKNGKKEKNPPTDDEKMELMGEITNKLGQKTDEFLFTVKIKSTDEIKTWTQISGIRAALKEFIDKRGIGA